ncbi:uncharacterized protein BJX67DRAFT_361156 [Aspergillus lucknowensis]|uniref:Uncharacterized protein n=1 Tax=Aspergillus lucknowensis TaxID=176173 RepID=A0ABR4LIT2_9EURO
MGLGMMNYEDLSLKGYEVLEGVAPDNPSSLALPDQDAESTEEAHNTPSPFDAFPEAEIPYYQPYTLRPLAVPRPLFRPTLTRRSNCHHSIVSRQWTIDQYETCGSCGRRPFMRWFYVCAEESYGDSISGGSLLSPWITEAILAGEYTDTQRNMLLEQKLRVLEMCERARKQEEYDISFRLENMNEHGFHNPHPGVPQPRSQPSRCRYRACYHCDRKLQDRTWLSLNAVCNDPNIKPPTAWDLWDTPVSDVKFVSNLGLRNPPPPPPPPPHRSQYAYLAFQLRRRSQYVYDSRRAGYGSYSSFQNPMTMLSTIEEVSDEE